MLIKVHVHPEAKKEKVELLKNGAFDIRIREPAEDNRANERILEIVRSMHPKVPIRLIKGHHSPHKIISIGGDD